MNKSPKPLVDTLDENLKSIEAFWRKSPFHDMAIESIIPMNRRLIVTLTDAILVFTGVAHFKQNIDEMPTSWLSQKTQLDQRDAEMTVECEMGEFRVRFANLRLFRRSDMSILIPAVDG